MVVVCLGSIAALNSEGPAFFSHGQKTAKDHFGFIPSPLLNGLKEPRLR
jgi:hypothetical protein